MIKTISKLKLGSKAALYPYPVCLLGTIVNGKPNFMTLSFSGIVNTNPAMVAIGCGRSLTTYKGIQ